MVKSRIEKRENRGVSAGLRDLYRTLELPGKDPLRDAHDALDAAYKLGRNEGVPAFLLALNKKVSQAEAANRPVTAPGLPPCIADRNAFVTDDCVRIK